MDNNHMTERMLNLTLEIIYLLTGEDYTVVNKSGERVTPISGNPCVSGGLSKIQNPVLEPPPHSLIHEKVNDQKILELTNNIIQLLTGEVPVRCQDVTVYFSMEEWEYLEGHKDLYKDVMMENRQPLRSKDFASSRNTSLALNLHMLSPDSICEDPSLTICKPKAKNSVKVAQELAPCEDHLQVTNISTCTRYTQTEPTDTEEGSSSFDEGTNVTITPTENTLMGYTSEVSKSYDDGNQTSPDFYALTEQTQDASTQPGNEMDSCEENDNYSSTGLKSAGIPDGSDSWDQSLTYTKSYTPTNHTDTQYTSTCIIEVSTLCDEGNVTCTDIYTPTEHRQTPYTSARTGAEPTSWGKNILYTNIYTPTELTQADLTNIKKELVSWEDGSLALKNMYIPPKHAQGKITPSSGRGNTTTWDSSPTHNYPQAQYTSSRIKTEFEEGNFADVYTPPEHTQTAYATIDIEDYNKDTSNTDKRNKNLSIISCTAYDETFNSRLTCATSQIIQMYNCPGCKKCFSNSSNLAKHRLICKGRKPHVCSGCGKCFASASYLVIHERIHTGEKPYSCSHCGKSFTRKPDLIRHERIHTGEKPFACPECGKCFTSVSNIFMHRRIHTGEKPFGCSECGKRFIKKSDLVRHEKIHMPQKPLPCSECGKFFGSKAILNKHMVVHAAEKQVTFHEGS